jgi:hypothetical protein
MLNRFTFACGLLVVLPVSAAAQAAQGPATLPARRILIDSIHAHNYLQPATPQTQYDYQWAYGYRKAFGFLAHRGMKVEEARGGRLDARRLEGVAMLFINVASADLPPFFVSEINAIRSYLESGGSLMLITEHTNCFFHSHKVTPLLEEVGVEIYNEAACERGGDRLGVGPSWLVVRRFGEHPVTRGLRAVALQAAGVVDGRFAVATTSEVSWGDAWICPPFGKGVEPGFYGNWMQDPGERAGPLGVILAKTVGKGRMVIVADHNCFGDPFLNYADNYKLFLNAVAWLTGEPGLFEAGAYENWRRPRLLCYDDYASASFGNTGAGGHFRAFAEIGKHFAAFACDDLSRGGDVLVFARSDALPPPPLDALLKHLRAEKPALLLAPGADDVQRRRGMVGQLITALGEATLEAGGGHVTLRWRGAGPLVLYTDRDGLANNRLASPGETPDAAQQARIRRLVGVLGTALPRAREPR